MSSFIDALFEQDEHCSCGHHRGSHNHGFTARACMWCECQGFTAADDQLEPVGARPPLRRSVALR
ncbi:MAG: hypothetical protein AAGE98_14165 [Actinomycetota bacterium]